MIFAAVAKRRIADLRHRNQQRQNECAATGAPTLLLNKHGKFKDVSTKLTGAVEGKVPFRTSDVTTRGGVWVDINNDKQVDLYIIRDGGPNVLYKQDNLLFQDISVNARIDLNSQGRSVVTADFDSDGLQDLYVVNFHESNKLFINNGDETFRDALQTLPMSVLTAEVCKHR